MSTFKITKSEAQKKAVACLQAVKRQFPSLEPDAARQETIRCLELQKSFLVLWKEHYDEDYCPQKYALLNETISVLTL